MSLFKRIKNIIKSNINYSGKSSDWNCENYSSDYKTFDDSSCRNTQNAQSSKNDIEKEYYGNLELPYGAGFEDIKKSYRKLLKKYHPDRFHGNEKKLKIAQDVVKKLNTAYEYFEKKYN